VCIWMAGDGAHAQGIQAGIVESLQPARIAGVCIDVNNTFSGTRTNSLDGLLYTPPLQQRLAFAALSEADDGLFGMFQMGNSYLGDFVDGGDEGQAILRGNQVFFFLFRDTADAASVAAGRDSNCHLPAAIEEVAGRGARVI